jgi:hypothetical protein
MDLAGDQARSSKSAEETAEKLGIGRDKFERTRTVQDHADQEVKQAVLDEEIGS